MNQEANEIFPRTLNCFIDEIYNYYKECYKSIYYFRSLTDVQLFLMPFGLYRGFHR